MAFQEDDNPLTTGNGRFELEANAEKTIDVPPHDLTYFEHQLLGLRNYFNTVSGGKLLLEADVYPKDAASSYTVSEQMSHYAPVGDEALLDRRLAEFFQEAFQVADATDNIDFSQYDVFILFHSGVGSDFSFDFDPTPQDIPSLFLSFTTLLEQLGNNDPTYEGIPVNGGSTFVRDGLVLPETQSQEGFEIGLLGTMAIMFGSQVGLPILFNPDNGRAGIGVFGMMDQGSGNFFGLLPAEPCAWSKVFLGWETPIEVSNGMDLPVAAPQAANDRKIYKIPINANEYFLVENRNRDTNRDGIAVGRDANGTRVEFHWDENGQRLLAEAAPGVITQVSEYDFGLPGSGILIWHIDENIIAANLAANRVNADPEHRGVDLEEADGAQDIGQFYGFLSPGAGSENGVVEDMFWGSNEINMLVNDNSDVVQFTPFTRPGSRSNMGANSHIFMTGFSERDSVMQFTVQNTISQNGFPQSVGEVMNSYNSPIAVDLDNDGEREILFIPTQEGTGGAAGHVHVWKADGTPYFATSTFAEPVGTKSFSVSVAPSGASPVVIAVTDQEIAAYVPEDKDANDRADRLFTLDLGAEITTHPLVVPGSSEAGDFQVVVGTADGRIFAVTSDGRGKVLGEINGSPMAGFAMLSQTRIAFATQTGISGVVSSQESVIWQTLPTSATSSAPVAGDLNGDGRLNVMVLSDNGQLRVFEEDGSLVAGFPRETDRAVSSQLVLADLDGDELQEVVFVSRHELITLNHLGALKDGFPIEIRSGDVSSTRRRAILSSPILADLNGDGQPELIVGSDQNKVEAYDLSGAAAVNFPLSTGAGVNSTPVISDLDSDGDSELVAVSDDQSIYVWDLPNSFRPEDVLWGGFLRDAFHRNANPELKQAREPGGRLMPPDLVYNYPNPTEGVQTTIRYRLNDAATVRIRIYDLAGEFVDELVGPGFPQAENEVKWQLDNIESGVYLARVEAQGASGRDVAIIKIAVVK
ncbi:MAG: FG-GAP-like repeat-containing protein [bacterium]